MDVVPWPANVADRYRSSGYWRGEPLGGIIADHVARRPDATAIIDGHTRWTYAEVNERADRFASGVAALGFAPGDRVVVQLPNVAEFVPLLLGLFRLGAVPVMALPAYRRAEAVHLCRTSGAVAYVVADNEPGSGFDYRVLAGEVTAEAPSVRQVIVAGDAGPYLPLKDIEDEPQQLPAPAAGTLALLLVSGGTTGAPKLIPRTHDDYFYNLRASAQVCGLGKDSVYLAALPVGHNFPLGCPGVLGTLFAGGTVVMCRTPSPRTVLAAIEQHRVTCTAAVPPLAAQWAQAASAGRWDLSSLQMLQVGGARLSVDAAQRLVDTFGPVLQQVFGMAEGLLCYTRPGDGLEVIVGTQGRPMSPDDELRIVDENDAQVAPGSIGQLLTRGPYTIRGYYHAEEYNRGAFTADGFYRTGDLVRQTAAGDIVVEGRAKDLVNRAGEKISTDEVQDHLRSHPAILDAALVAVPDPRLGERSCACLVLRDGFDEAPDVVDYLRGRGLADYKIPDVVRVLPSLPVTAVGKVDKRALASILTS
jgi:2,3-dihydroxybenzoate-AMP ligase